MEQLAVVYRNSPREPVVVSCLAERHVADWFAARILEEESFLGKKTKVGTVNYDDWQNGKARVRWLRARRDTGKGKEMKDDGDGRNSKRIRKLPKTKKVGASSGAATAPQQKAASLFDLPQDQRVCNGDAGSGKADGAPSGEGQGGA